MQREIVKMVNYDTFRCSADQCSFTCCQQWKIAVDEATESTWCEWGMAESIVTRDGGRVIALNEQGKCPYLNEEKLCDLVIAHGDEMIPRTCRVFPRQVHAFSGRTEYALVACCPDVVNWLFQAEAVVAAENLAWPPKSGEKDAGRVLRDWMICQVQDRKYSVETNLKMIFYVLLELHRNGEKDLVRGLKACVKDLPKLAAAIQELPTNWEDSLRERNELFLDVTENYWKQGIYREQLEPLREAAEVFDGEVCAGKGGSKEYDRLFRNYLACEFFANALLPETSLVELIVMVQWIAMEYALIRHGLCLQKGEMTWENVREWIVVMARMTGYDLEDIEEYFENSFESVIWEWGYLALILPE